MQNKHVTITGFKHYFGRVPFSIGALIRCRKEPDNCYDKQAIRCFLPLIGTVGYLANSSHTTAGGTLSAGQLYELVDDRFYVRVMFITSGSIICRVESGPLEALDLELTAQLDHGW